MKKKKMKGTFGTARAYEDLRGEPAGKKGMMEALRQAVENGEDAILEKFDVRTAGEIRIVLNKRTQETRILDNGKGFGDPEIRGFFSWFDSPKRGKGNRLIGQHGSGRVFLLRYCRKIRVYSVSEQYPTGIMLELTEEDLKEIFDKKVIDGDYYYDVDLPSWWHLPKGATGSAIELIDADWKRMPSPQEIIDTFATYFRPSIARKIRVNDKPLKDLKIVGEPVECTFPIAGLGDMEVEVYIPREHQRWHVVQLGAHNPTCPVRDFVDCLDAETAKLIPDMLLHSMAGVILFPGINPHVAPDRKSFKDSMFTGPHLVVANAIAEHLEPLLVEAYYRKEREDQRRRETVTSKIVCEALSEAFDFDPRDLKKLEGGEGSDLPEGTQTPTEGLTATLSPTVVRRRVEIMVADNATFRVPQMEGVNEEGIQWDATRSGGFLNVSQGPETVYTAGEVVGKFLLLARDMACNRTIMEVTIAIVAAKEFRITPSKRDVEQGSFLKLRVRNYDTTSGRIGWKMKRQRGVRLPEPEGLQTELQITDDAPLVTFQVTAYDLENPSLEATGEYEIVVGDKGNYLKLRDCTGKDHHFEFKRAATLQPQMVTLSMPSSAKARIAMVQTADKSPTVGKVTVNFEHPNFQHLVAADPHATEGREAWLQHLTPNILLAFLDEQVRIGILDPVDFSREFQELQDTIIAARARSKQK